MAVGGIDPTHLHKNVKSVNNHGAESDTRKNSGPTGPKDPSRLPNGVSTKSKA